MRVHFDTEFLEGTQDIRVLGIKTGLKTKPTIDLISIGMVREDGQEYYAVSKDFNLKEAWNRYDLVKQQFSGDMRNIFPEGRNKKVYWIRENVLKPIFRELLIRSEDTWFAYASEIEYQKFLEEVRNGNYEHLFTYKNFKKLLKVYGKSNKEIALEVQEFCYGFAVKLYPKENTDKIAPNVTLYGYYSAYDHVALCWLFGKMIDLPKGFPMYTIDLKQTFDEKVQERFDKYISEGKDMEKNRQVPLTKKHVSNILKREGNYPKQENEHNALADAIWTKKLHEFLDNI